MYVRDETKIKEAMEKVAANGGGGSIRALAAKLDVSTQAIYKWLKEGIPVKRALQMSIMTKGAVQWYELVPEVLEELRAGMVGAE